jgi:hypothetical protein
VDIRIGVIYSPKELTVEMSDHTSPDELQKQINDAVASGSGMLWLTDRRGRQVGVPIDRLTYVEIGSPDDARRIGFGA